MFAQEPASAPSFEVAAIKPSPDPTGSSSGIFETKGRIEARNVTLRRCIRGAYDIAEAQIVGGPKWIDQDRFYIEAKAAVPADDPELMLMLRTLLAERFKLVLHEEKRVVSGYQLVLGKSGLKAQSSASKENSAGNLGRGRLEAKGYSMSQLAIKLAEVLHAPVIDRTGLTGKFDFNLRWTPDEMQTSPSQDAASGPSIFSALQEQLGLKLEAGKIPGNVLVIDSAEKPSAN
jgi:uncharacterized protein (TIGR03435 family)